MEISVQRPGRHQLGLCCLNTELRALGIFCSRKPILSTIEKKGVAYLKTCYRENVQDLIKMLKWNARNGIRVFRISSDLFPHKSNASVPHFDLNFVQDLLTEAGEFARATRQRLTFHPGPYNIVGSHNTDHITPWQSETLYKQGAIVLFEEIMYAVKSDHTSSSPFTLGDLYTRCIFQKTIDDLGWQAETLDRMGCNQDSVMVVHAGALYGDKKATKCRWVKNYNLLPEAIRRRLVLENCEKCFNIEDCLDVSAQCGVPVVFDTHHYTCYAQLHPTEVFHPEAHYIPLILETWTRRGIKPKFHVSNQACCGKVGKHSDYIECIPEFLLNIEMPIDIMIEAKQKELAIQRLYAVHPELKQLPCIRFKRKINAIS